MNDKSILKRAMSLAEAKAHGLVTSDYDYENLPEEFIGVLEYKVWGKSLNLLLYLKSNNGKKYAVSAYTKKAEKYAYTYKYTPKNMPDFDLSTTDIQPGIIFRVVTGKNKNGKSALLETYISDQ